MARNRRPPVRGEDPSGKSRPPGDGRPGVTVTPGLGTGSEREKYLRWAKSHNVDAKTAGDAWHWARTYNVDPYYFVSVLLVESGARRNSPDSSAGAIGIGQILPDAHVGAFVPWPPGNKTRRITEADLRDYSFNIRYAAFYLSQQVQEFGYDGAWAAYNRGPNAARQMTPEQRAQVGRRPLATVPPGRELAPSAGEGQTPDPGKGPTPEPFDDPFVAGVKKGGKLALTGDPAKALKWDGIPVRRSEFLRLKRQLEDTFVSFTGKRPTPAQVQQFIQKGWSDYTLSVVLSKTKAFTNSPLWKSRAPVYEEAARQLLAPNEKMDKELVRQAIVNNWTPDVLMAELRKRPSYVKSNEFKGRTATLMNVYQSIYGLPDDNSMKIIQEATLGGWEPDQFAAWLRSRDEYAFTVEYRDKAVRLVEELGFLTGKVPVLKPVAAGPPSSEHPGGFGPLPDDERIPGQGSLPTGVGFVGGARGA